MSLLWVLGATTSFMVVLAGSDEPVYGADEEGATLRAGSAPRVSVERFKDRYLTADLAEPRAMVRIDITNIPYPDRSFDVIICSHDLEHVPDDRKAIAEMFRTLDRDGLALILVPITAEQTLEDPSI